MASDEVWVRCATANTSAPGGLYWEKAGDVILVPDALARQLIAIEPGDPPFSIVQEPPPPPAEVTEPAPAAEVTEPAPKVAPKRAVKE
jgi:hypothetical protein